MRSLLAAAAALSVLAPVLPAAAQTPDELVGVYPASASYTGADCGEGRVAQVNVEVMSASLSAVSIAFWTNNRGTPDPREAVYSPGSRTFRYDGAGRRETSYAGRFERRADHIRIEVDVNQGGCVAHLVGMRPLPPGSAPAAPPASAPTPGPGAAPPSILGVPTSGETPAQTPPPASAPAAAPAQGNGLTTVLFGVIGVLLLIIGVGAGWFLARRKTEAGDDA